MRLETVERDVLADEDADACRAHGPRQLETNGKPSGRKKGRTDAAHVEAVEERLDRAVDVGALAVALELEDALGDRRHDRVVSPLDAAQDARELVVVVVHLGGPHDRLVRVRVVAASRGKRLVSSAPRAREAAAKRGRTGGAASSVDPACS